MPQRTCGTPGCPNAHRAKGLCSSCYNRQHQPNRHRKATIVCVACGRTHLSARSTGRYCSEACRSSDYARRGIRPPVSDRGPWSRRRRARFQQAKAAAGTVGRLWVAGSCQRCGHPFVSAPTNDAGIYCSNTCKRRTSSSRRRARTVGALHVPYSRHSVFERDRWRCHICRRTTDPNQVVPHPRAPTIDHLVPLFEGGSDTAANVATACFLCNSTKGQRGGGEQLALM